MNVTAKIKILCYGDSNTWGWVPGKMGTERFDEDIRWTGLIQYLLGEQYEIIEEGLGGRNTAYDDPRSEMPMRNGLQTLPFILETHSPIDIITIMLGTTDCKEIMNLTPNKLAKGWKNLSKSLSHSNQSMEK